MAEEKTRVDFNAPTSLVERADAVADVLDVSRTRLLIDALDDELAELARDESFRRRIGDAYYSGRIDDDTVESVLGREEAMRMRVLRGALDRDPPVPDAEELPDDADFYDGDVPTWAPSETDGREEGDART